MSLLTYASLTHRRRAYRSTDANVLLSSQTADADSTVSFTSGIDSTYGEYIFKFYNYNPSANSTHLTVQFNAAGGSGYNETITSTVFQAYANEGDSDVALTYKAAEDQAQGTAFQSIAESTGSGADESAAGEMHLFNPSSTTYVKHFFLTTVNYHASDYVMNNYIAGYINTTSAIDEVQFKAADTFDGKFKMWGVK